MENSPAPVDARCLNHGDVLRERLEPYPVRLDDRNRDVTCFACFDIGNGSGFSSVCAPNDFALSAIFEVLRGPDLHVVEITTGEPAVSHQHFLSPRWLVGRARISDLCPR